MKTALENLKSKYTGDDLRREVTALIYKLSGTAHRFERQALYRELTGENILVAQAGINRVSEAALRYLIAEPAEVVVFEDKTDEETPVIQLVAGLLVVRKACKRKGAVQKVDGDKVYVLLEDGSVRKPNRERFEKLYSRI